MHQLHHRTISALYAAMACALTAGVDHTLLAGIYLVVALTYWVSSNK
jgi:hypothetical protein